MGDNDWDTVTKIGYRANQTRPTTVKTKAELNAAARAGTLQTEKKFTGMSPSPSHYLLVPSLNLQFRPVRNLVGPPSYQILAFPLC